MKYIIDECKVDFSLLVSEHCTLHILQPWVPWLISRPVHQILVSACSLQVFLLSQHHLSNLFVFRQVETEFSDNDALFRVPTTKKFINTSECEPTLVYAKILHALPFLLHFQKMKVIQLRSRQEKHQSEDNLKDAIYHNLLDL